MCRKILSLALVFGLLSAPCLLFSAPQPSSPSVTLSQADFDAVMAAIKQAREALVKSNLEIAMLSRRSTWQWILCGTLGAAVVVEGVALALK